MVKVFENVIPENHQAEMEQFMLGWEFCWFHYPNTNYVELVTQDNDTPQFCHGFFRNDQSNSKYAAIPLTILKGFNLDHTHIIRAKANLMIREKESIINPKHTDDEQPHQVLIYYVNDSDGETYIWQDDGSVETIEPKRGRAVVFDGSLLHSSSTPVDHRYRIVLNFNLKPGSIEI
jgi:hypothetical protein